MATTHSRCSFSITVHGNAVIGLNLVSFGGPILQHSCAMNTQCMQHVFCKCIFVSEEGWNFGYNHELLCLCQTRDGNSCIFGWTQAKYSCTIEWAEFMYCYVSLEVPYWNLEQTKAGGHGLGLDQAKLKLR